MGSESKKSDEYEIATAAKPEPVSEPVSDKVGKAAPKCAEFPRSADCIEPATGSQSLRSSREARWALDVEWCLRMMS